MSFEQRFHHRAMRFCALIGVNLLLLAFVSAPKTERRVSVQAARLAVTAVFHMVPQYAGRAAFDDVERPHPVSASLRTLS